MYGTGAQVRRIRIKLLQLLYDLVINDETIVNDGYFVRDTLAADARLIPHLLMDLKNSDVTSAPENQIRIYRLNILFRVYQRNQSSK